VRFYLAPTRLKRVVVVDEYGQSLVDRSGC
jgi:hypothetical protein